MFLWTFQSTKQSKIGIEQNWTNCARCSFRRSSTLVWIPLEICQKRGKNKEENELNKIVSHNFNCIYAFTNQIHRHTHSHTVAHPYAKPCTQTQTLPGAKVPQGSGFKDICFRFSQLKSIPFMDSRLYFNA